jgi:hypothetical protein
MKKNSEILEQLRGECANMTTAQARAHIEKKQGFEITLTGKKPALHYTVFYNGERIANIEGIRGVKGTRGANSTVTVTRRPRKVTASRTTTAAVNVTRLALSYFNDLDKEYADKKATADNTAAAAVTALKAALQSGLYTAAADYLNKALTAATTAAAAADRAREIVTRAADIRARYTDFCLYKIENRRNAADYDKQQRMLSVLDETTAATVTAALKTSGQYIEAPATFARPLCDGLQAVTAADLITAETAATFAAADRDRAAAELYSIFANQVDYVDNLAARLDMTAAEVIALFCPAVLPDNNDVKVEATAAATPARKGRAKKTA